MTERKPYELPTISPQVWEQSRCMVDDVVNEMIWLQADWQDNEPSATLVTLAAWCKTAIDLETITRALRFVESVNCSRSSYLWYRH